MCIYTRYKVYVQFVYIFYCFKFLNQDCFFSILFIQLTIEKSHNRIFFNISFGFVAFSLPPLKQNFYDVFAVESGLTIYNEPIGDLRKKVEEK